MADKDAVDHFRTTKAHRAHTEDEKDMDQISWEGRMNQPPGSRLQMLGAGFQEEGEEVSREKKLVDGYKPSVVVEVASGSQEEQLGEGGVVETLARAVGPNLVAKP